MMDRERLRLAWAVSGQGRALKAVVEAADQGLFAVDVVLVITDRRSDIEGFAQRRGIACRRLEPVADLYHPSLPGILRDAGTDWMGLTFNRMIRPEAISALAGRVFNLHLSLLPLFPGFGASRRAVEAGMRLTGATVHLVNAGMDTGPILAQGACPIADQETVENVGRKQFFIAVPMLLQVVRAIAQGELTCDAQQRVTWPRSREVRQESSIFPYIDADIRDFANAFCQQF